MKAIEIVPLFVNSGKGLIYYVRKVKKISFLIHTKVEKVDLTILERIRQKEKY